MINFVKNLFLDREENPTSAEKEEPVKISGRDILSMWNESCCRQYRSKRPDLNFFYKLLEETQSEIKNNQDEIFSYLVENSSNNMKPIIHFMIFFEIKKDKCWWFENFSVMDWEYIINEYPFDPEFILSCDDFFKGKVPVTEENKDFLLENIEYWNGKPLLNMTKEVKYLKFVDFHFCDVREWSDLVMSGVIPFSEEQFANSLNSSRSLPSVDFYKKYIKGKIHLYRFTDNLTTRKQLGDDNIVPEEEIINILTRNDYIDKVRKQCEVNNGRI